MEQALFAAHRSSHCSTQHLANEQYMFARRKTNVKFFLALRSLVYSPTPFPFSPIFMDLQGNF